MGTYQPTYHTRHSCHPIRSLYGYMRALAWALSGIPAMFEFAFPRSVLACLPILDNNIYHNTLICMLYYHSLVFTVVVA